MCKEHGCDSSCVQLPARNCAQALLCFFSQKLIKGSPWNMADVLATLRIDFAYNAMYKDGWGNNAIQYSMILHIALHWLRKSTDHRFTLIETRHCSPVYIIYILEKNMALWRQRTAWPAMAHASQHGGCYWLGSYLASDHLQTPWWCRPVGPSQECPSVLNARSMRLCCCQSTATMELVD